MENNEVFSVISQCFAPIDKAQWETLTKDSIWSAFIAGILSLLQGEKTSQSSISVTEDSEIQRALQNCLSKGEVKALFVPPSYEEKQAFAAYHFTGGLPESAPPVESLYVPWSQTDVSSPFSRMSGMYDSDTAYYMRDLVGRFGFELPQAFVSYPDHLVIELDLVAVMLRSGMQDDAWKFLAERFDWLTAYRKRLLEISGDASFYIGLIDVVLGVRAQQKLMMA